MIKKTKAGKFQLHTKDGTRKLGPPTSLKKAQAQERAIQAAKHSRGQ